MCREVLPIASHYGESNFMYWLSICLAGAARESLMPTETKEFSWGGRCPDATWFWGNACVVCLFDVCLFYLVAIIAKLLISLQLSRWFGRWSDRWSSGFKGQKLWPCPGPSGNYRWWSSNPSHLFLCFLLAMVLDTPIWWISLSLIFLQNDKLRWWSIFREPEHELVGKIQLYINFSTSADETSHPKVKYL